MPSNKHKKTRWNVVIYQADGEKNEKIFSFCSEQVMISCLELLVGSNTQ